MDTCRGGQDPRYYCLPPFHGNAGREVKHFYLVSQGRVVGVFDDWRVYFGFSRATEADQMLFVRLTAKASVSGFPDNSHRAYKSMEECIVAWQALCRLGVHPHNVDPGFDHTARHPPARALRMPPPSTSGGAKQEETPTRRAAADDPTTAPPPPFPASTWRAMPPTLKTPVHEEGHFLNFAIRGAGIVSSNATRTERRYRELQSRGEEPELLVAHCLQEASFFAVDEGDEV
ncbi:hypothetical protein K438DRAFT_1955857 [Mycena galopus ATCC 62051]|nr:hypothetical protein K438DRAFT_1955857 [Mycena galopus ATCC 62051]